MYVLIYVLCTGTLMYINTASFVPCLLYDARPTSQTAAMNVKKLKMSSQVSRGILREKLPETTPELARKSEGTDSKVHC